MRSSACARGSRRRWIFPKKKSIFSVRRNSRPILARCSAQLAELLAAARRGVILRDGLHVVIVGRPNAGKSSLLNALAQSERAIVTAIPGTTRDVLREGVNLDGIALTLVDTAGLRESGDVVEREGMRRARAELARADVAILVTDSTHVDSRPALLDDCADRRRAADRAQQDRRQRRNARASSAPTATKSTCTFLPSAATAWPNCATNWRASAGRGDGAQGAFSARARHVDALERVAAHLRAADAALRDERAGELAARRTASGPARARRNHRRLHAATTCSARSSRRSASASDRRTHAVRRAAAVISPTPASSACF